MNESTDSRQAIPPGEFIREELKSRGWGQDDLAQVLGRTTARVNQIITGKQELSPEIAIELEAVFGTPATVWLQREAVYRLSLTTVRTGGVKRRNRLLDLGPVRDMQKRGWLRPAEQIEEVEPDLLRFFCIGEIDAEPSIHGAMRKTAPAVRATPAQRAWAFRVRHLAAAIPAASLARYEDAKLSECLRAIRKLASYSAGVAKAPGLLASYGIRFVVVEGLPSAKLDGFATWLDEQSPVIGMSLRYDRLDSFWFTLGHELSHIKHRDVAPVDGDVSGADDLLEVKPPMERRADDEAASTFIPPDELKSFILRAGPLYQTERINQFANRIKMHPSVIIGQLKHRGEIAHSKHTKNTVQIREAVIATAVTDGWGKSITLGEGV